MKKQKPIEKYDAIIQSVEDKILSINPGETVETYDIAKQIAKDQNYGSNDRALSAIVNFLQINPLIHYIKERRMMLATKTLIEAP